ncbi:D-aminoacyl-tRNA deacylase [Candidatus Dependentiae bacterium]
MKALIQRVSSASVSVDNKIVSKIGHGFLVFLGIKADDTQKDRDYIIKKIVNLRVFPEVGDATKKMAKKMDRSIGDVGGEILLVSQFTLYADCRKGNRPSFINAMSPEQAKSFYCDFAVCLRKNYDKVKEGVFGAYMQVALTNDGPVTILIDSTK